MKENRQTQDEEEKKQKEIEQKLDEIGQKLEEIEQKPAKIEQKLDEIEQQSEKIEQKLEKMKLKEISSQEEHLFSDKASKSEEVPEIKEWSAENIKPAFPWKKWLWIFIPLGSVLLLFLVFQISWQNIKGNEKAFQMESYKKVFLEGEEFEKTEYDAAQIQAVLKKAGFEHLKMEEIVAVKDKSGNRIGTVYQMTHQKGYGGELTMSFGMNGMGSLCGIQIDRISDVADLTIKKEQNSFLKQFLYGNNTKEFWIGPEIFGGLQVQAMEGAPITSQAVVELVNGLLLLDKNFGFRAGGAVNE